MTIDTNILIAYLAGEQKIIDILKSWHNERRVIFLPAVVEAELLSFPDWSDSEKETVLDFLEENFVFVTFDRLIARTSADLRSHHNIKLPDASIAATALITRTPLATRNTKDFKGIPDLELLLV